MKRFLLAAALLALLLALSLANARHVQSITDALAARLEQAQAMAQVNQWDQARALTAQAYHDWQDSHFYLHSTMRHADTDAILRTFHSVLQYLALQEMDQYAAANADLVAQIRLLAEMEQPTLVNVL